MGVCRLQETERQRIGEKQRMVRSGRDRHVPKYPMERENEYAISTLHRSNRPKVISQ